MYYTQIVQFDELLCYLFCLISLVYVNKVSNNQEEIPVSSIPVTWDVVVLASVNPIPAAEM